MRFYILPVALCFFFLAILTTNTSAQVHEITFCGEKIPVDNNFVAQKLMGVIRQQIPHINVSQLRKRADKFFPIVEYYLRKTGLPLDFKYIAIVESGFSNATSSAGAQGVWQLMPSTATGYNIQVDEMGDDRNDFYKATWVACQLLADNYLGIRKRFNISSWILTAAAYNFGLGNMSHNIKRQGKDYFSMNLNAETAVYVYKLIAVKELFEYPELYIKDFGYNVFDAKAAGKTTRFNNARDTMTFNSLQFRVNENDGKHGAVKTLSKNYIPPNKNEVAESEKNAKKEDNLNVSFIPGVIKGKYKDFTDGDEIAIELQRDLNVRNSFIRGGVTITGKGWIVNGRVFIDLGFNEHDVILYDSDAKNGIALSDLKKKNATILLKIQGGD